MLPKRTIACEYTLADERLELIEASFAERKILELSRKNGLNIGWLDRLDDLSTFKAIKVNGGGMLGIRYNYVV